MTVDIQHIDPPAFGFQRCLVLDDPAARGSKSAFFAEFGPKSIGHQARVSGSPGPYVNRSQRRSVTSACFS